MPEVGVVAALRMEVADKLRHWRTGSFAHAGRTYQTFQTESAALVFGGMGREPARQAAESLVWKFGPKTLVSLGFAGAAAPELRVGDIFMPARIHSDQGEAFLTHAERATGTLVTTSRIAGPGEKRDLRKRYSADAVDMEAAAVARVALGHGLGFLAVKAISDAPEQRMPPFERFARSDGTIDAGGFGSFAVLRPQLWPALWRLARNASVASAALARWLSQYNEELPVRPHTPKEIAGTR